MYSSPPGLGTGGKKRPAVPFSGSRPETTLSSAPSSRHDAAHHSCMRRSRSQRRKSSRALAPTSEIDQPVALEAAVNARARRNGTQPRPGELALDAPRLRRQATLLVAGDPVMDTLAAHQEPPGHLDDLPPVLQGSGGRWHPLTLPPRPPPVKSPQRRTTSDALGMGPDPSLSVPHSVQATVGAAGTRRSERRSAAPAGSALPPRRAGQPDRSSDRPSGPSPSGM